MSSVNGREGPVEDGPTGVFTPPSPVKAYALVSLSPGEGEQSQPDAEGFMRGLDRGSVS